MAYRSDIDGLRALAVLAVVFYHAGLTAISGGFIGVDIFFVISGYLITLILIRDIQEQQFSLLKFYERRIRRILPALFVMSAAVTIAAIVLFIPFDLKEFGKSLTATFLSASNILFWKLGGYFDSSADLKPLLHTWSLAVEEQYYIFFPLFLAWAYRTQRHLQAWVAALLLLSLGFSIYQVSTQPSAAFYLPFARTWELLVGSLVALGWPVALTTTWLRQLAAILGLSLTVSAVFVIDAKSLFPGALALLPCLGAGLVIYSGGQTLVARMLSLPPLVAIGRLSYSLYLWHWPLLVLPKYYLLRDYTHSEQLLAIVASFIVAYFSYRFVEVPYRQRRLAVTWHALFLQTGVAVTMMAATGAILFVSGGLPQRFSPDIRAIVMETTDINPDRARCNGKSGTEIAAGKACTIGDPAQAPSYVVLGDSFADSFLPGIKAAGDRAGATGIVLTQPGCYPLAGIQQHHANGRLCQSFVRESLNLIRNAPSITKVILIARWTSAAEGIRFGSKIEDSIFITDAASQENIGPDENRLVFRRALARTISELAAKDVFVVAYMPEQPFHVPRSLGLCREFTRPCPAPIDYLSFMGRQQYVRSVFTAMQSPHLHILDLGSILCTPAAGCQIMRDGVPLYSDDNHLSWFGALAVQSLYDPVFAPTPQEQ